MYDLWAALRRTESHPGQGLGACPGLAGLLSAETAETGVPVRCRCVHYRSTGQAEPQVLGCCAKVLDIADDFSSTLPSLEARALSKIRAVSHMSPTTFESLVLPHVSSLVSELREYASRRFARRGMRMASGGKCLRRTAFVRLRNVRLHTCTTRLAFHRAERRLWTAKEAFTSSSSTAKMK